jgi:hypothetical protein
VVILTLLWVGIEGFGLPDAVGWGALLVTLLLAIPLWKGSERSVVEATEAGVTQRRWDGSQHALAWSEIARVKVHASLSLMTLYDHAGVARLRFTTQRNDFFTFTLLLSHYCPEAWRLGAPKQVGASGSYWVLALLVGAGLIRVAWVAWQNPSVVAVLVALGFLLGFGGVLWLLTGRLTIQPAGVVITRWRQQTMVPFEAIASMGWTLKVVRHSRYYEPSMTLTDGKTLDLGGFGNGVLLFCTILRAWLDARRAEMVVRWGSL